MIKIKLLWTSESCRRANSIINIISQLLPDAEYRRMKEKKETPELHEAYFKIHDIE